jgi:hypothetical protein
MPNKTENQNGPKSMESNKRMEKKILKSVIGNQKIKRQRKRKIKKTIIAKIG